MGSGRPGRCRNLRNWDMWTYREADALRGGSSCQISAISCSAETICSARTSRAPSTIAILRALGAEVTPPSTKRNGPRISYRMMYQPHFRGPDVPVEVRAYDGGRTARRWIAADGRPQDHGCA